MHLGDKRKKYVTECVRLSRIDDGGGEKRKEKRGIENEKQNQNTEMFL